VRRWLVFFTALVLLAACSSSSKAPKNTDKSSPSTTVTTVPVATGPTVGHVFVINLENKSYAKTWGTRSAAKYLNDKLVPMGQLLTQYYGTSHASLGNYITQISGQPSNPATDGDCAVFTEYRNGRGCVYPSSVQTIADQLDGAGRSWKSYQEDMRTPCRHPRIGDRDTTLVARRDDMYATRHNPFVYFHSIIDTPQCKANVVDLQALDADIGAAERTPSLVYITPNLCHDGHDTPCVDGQPGGLVSADKFLQTWVPKILASPAYEADGLLVITLDESDNDASSCCGQKKGAGGGRIGTLLLSPHVKAGTTNKTPYNHYSLLCSIEDAFGLPHLAGAGASGLNCFGDDVYS
jgi:phosphatidylinositol-3-phosphatase